MVSTAFPHLSRLESIGELPLVNAFAPLQILRQQIYGRGIQKSDRTKYLPPQKRLA